MKTAILLLLTLAVCDGYILDFINKKWNGLKVTFGFNPFNSNTFASLPRTVSDAGRYGFTQISSCQDTPMFRGNRYARGGDYAVVLLFDEQGYIAGIQAGIPDGQSNGYPFQGLRPPFVLHENNYFVTAYFVDPSTICSTGRNSEQFSDEGTGTDLYIQNGTNPETDSIMMPKQQSGLEGTRWLEGECFPSMGKHYWYDLTGSADCHNFFPVFLMYNRGTLNSFGWAFITDLTSPRYEHPSPSVFSKFIKNVPECLSEMGIMSTMHIYLTSTPRFNFC